MKKTILLLLFALFATSAAQSQPRRDVYLQHNLVSDLPAHAEVQDPKLANPWGIAVGPASPFWIADNKTGVSTLYDSAGRPFPPHAPLTVTIPAPAGASTPSSPTGIVFNGTTSFMLPGGPALFIFATEDGTIAAWNLSDPTHAVIKFDNSPSGAVYKGIAIATNNGANFLYATNFHAGTIDVFDTNFAPAGSFTDATVPPGYAPFGIRNIGGRLYVTFALQDSAKHDDVGGAGNGFVDMYDGVFHRLISNGLLNSPWGLAVAPREFGAFSDNLLVGNFGDGSIHAFDLNTGASKGTLLGPSGRPLQIPGLWGLTFGNGSLGGDPGILYFTAGIPGSGQIEDHGLFAEIRPQHR